MQPVDPTTIDLFRWASDLPAALWDDVDKRPPDQAAQSVGAPWDGAMFHAPLLGRRYAVDPSRRVIVDEDDPERLVSYQAGLVLLVSLANSTGAEPSGNMVLARELPGGDFFFVGPHAVNTAALERAYGQNQLPMIDRAVAMGGRQEPGSADAGVMVPALPKLPLWALVWRGDDEFPAKAVVGIDSRAHYHMDLGAIWALTNLFIHRLRGGQRE